MKLHDPDYGDVIDPKEIWNDLTYLQKICVASFIFTEIHNHLSDGGTFRKLIYDRIGLKTDAYGIMYASGGLTISNMCHEYRAWVEREENEEEDQKKCCEEVTTKAIIM